MSKSIADVELLKHCLQGHTQSFEVLVGRYQSLICAITYGATGNVDMSEELAQETFLLAWKNLRQLKDLAKFKAWLCRIAMNVVNNWRRSAQRDNAIQSASSESTSLDPATSFAPDEVAIQKEQQAVVSQALECLPENYRLPLILFYREDKSIREVADLIGLNENATRQRISRARGMLKKQVAAMVETTLSHSKPGKAFTASVVASLAGLAMKNVTTASAASLATSGLASFSLKIAGIAAGIAILIGTTLLVQHRKNTNPVSIPSPNSLSVMNIAKSNELALAPQGNPVPEEDSLGITQHDTSVIKGETVEPQTIPRFEDTPYVFKPQGVISGLITDAETGKPVRDATIELSNNGIGHVHTDKHGFYHIDRIFSPGNQRLYIDSNDYVGFGLNAGAPTLNVSQDQQIVRHFQLARACKIKVWVTDVNGIPIEKVEVIPTSLADNQKYEINDRGIPRRTDENGYLLLGGFPPSSTEYMITAIAKKTIRTRSMGNGIFLSETQLTHAPAKALVRLTDPNVVTEIKIVLEPGETIHGYAEYNDNVPATGAKIGVQPSWWHCMSSQDFYDVQADGTFAIGHITPGTYDVLLAFVNEEGLPYTSQVIMQMELPPLDGTPLFVPLPIPSAQSTISIRGQLFFPEDRLRELEDRFIMITLTADSPTLGSQRQHIQLLPGDDYQGKPFKIDHLKSGSYRLRIHGDNLDPVTLEEVIAPCENLNIELTVEDLIRPTLEGVVLDQETQKAITSFNIRLRKLKTLRGVNTIPSEQWISYHNQEGYFSLETVGPGIYQIQALAEGYAPNWSDPIDTDEGLTTEISLSHGGTLKGTVTDSSGSPIAHATVIPLSWAAGNAPSTNDLFTTEHGAVTTDANGNFTLPRLPEGSETLKISHPDYTCQITSDLSIVDQQTTLIDDIVLHAGGCIEGFVWDEQGQPLPNQVLIVQDEGGYSGTSEEEAGRLAMGTTDANGFYRISHLPCRLCFVNRPDPSKILGVSRRTVIPRQDSTVRLDFGGPVYVRGTLMGRGKPLASRRIVLGAPNRSPSAAFKCFTMTDSSGNFCFSGIAPGRYRLYVKAPTSSKGWEEVTVVTVSDHDVDLGLLNNADSELSLEIKASSSMPSKAILLVYLSAPGQSIVHFPLHKGQPSDQTNRLWTFPNVESGSYTLVVMTENIQYQQSIQLPPEGKPWQMTWKLPSNTGSLSGSLGQYPAGAQLWRSDRNIAASLSADQQGHYQIDNLPAGDYSIGTSLQYYYDLPPLAQIAISTGQERHLDINLANTTQEEQTSLIVQVSDENGVPREDAVLWLTGPLGQTQPIFAMQGSYVLISIPGQHILETTVEGYRQQEQLFTLQALTPGNDPCTITVKLKPE